MKPDGTMARLPDVVEFGKLHNMPVLTIEDLVAYRIATEVAEDVVARWFNA